MITTMLHSLWKNAGRVALAVGVCGMMLAQVVNAASATQPAAAKSAPSIEATNVEATVPATTPTATQTTASAATATANKGVVWETAVVKFDEVFKQDAEVNGSNTVLYFTANWCGFCRQMERTTLANGSVRDRMEKFRRIKVDFDTQPDFVTRYRIDGVPAFVMVNARGEEIARLVGMTEADPFRAWLETSEMQAAAQAAAILERRERLAGFAAVLDARETGADAWKNLKPSLLAMAARGVPEERAFAQQRLLAKGTQAPAELFDGLANEDLSVRLNTAVMLRKIIGAEFNFDPWADAAARAATIEKLNAVYGTKQAAAPAQTGGAASLSEAPLVTLAAHPDGRVIFTHEAEIETRSVRIRGAWPKSVGQLSFLADRDALKTGKVFIADENVDAAAAELARSVGQDPDETKGPSVSGLAGNPLNFVVGQDWRYPINWEPVSGLVDQWIAKDVATISVGVGTNVLLQMATDGSVQLQFKITDVSFVELVERAAPDGKTTIKGEFEALVNGKGDPSSRVVNKGPYDASPVFEPIFTSYAIFGDVRIPPGKTLVMMDEGRRSDSGEVDPWVVFIRVKTKPLQPWPKTKQTPRPAVTRAQG